MTEVTQGILAEAKKNRYSQIKDTLSDDGKIDTRSDGSHFYYFTFDNTHTHFICRFTL